MDLDDQSEDLLQRLLIGELDPDAPEAVAAFGRSQLLRERWQELRSLRTDVGDAADEARAVLAEARDAPTMLSDERIEELVRGELARTRAPRRRLVLMGAASMAAAATLVWWSLREVPTGLPEGPIVLNDRDSEIELLAPTRDARGRVVVEWTDPNASPFREYMVVIHAYVDGTMGAEVLRSGDLPDTRWELTEEQSATLPAWATYRVTAEDADGSTEDSDTVRFARP